MGFYWALMDSTSFYCDSLGPSLFYRVSPSFTVLFWVLLFHGLD